MASAVASHSCADVKCLNRDFSLIFLINLILLYDYVIHPNNKFNQVKIAVRTKLHIDITDERIATQQTML